MYVRHKEEKREDFGKKEKEIKGRTMVMGKGEESESKSGRCPSFPL